MMEPRGSNRLRMASPGFQEGHTVVRTKIKRIRLFVRTPNGIFPPRPAPPIRSLTITSFPHILSDILSHSSPSILGAFLQTSRTFYDIVSPLAYTNIRVNHRQLKRLFEAEGIAIPVMSTDLTTPTPAVGQALSQYHLRSLTQIKSLHLLDYRFAYNASLDLSRPCHLVVPNLVIHPWARWEAYWIPFLTGLLEALHTSHLYVRFPAHSNPFNILDHIQHYHLPSLANVGMTILVPLHRFFTHSLSWSMEYSQRNTAQALTLVLLPSYSAEHHPHGTIRYAQHPKFWGRVFNKLVRNAQHHRVRLVGVEYAGLTSEEVVALVKEASARVRVYLRHDEEGGLGDLITFMTFSDWLEEQEAGVLFAPAEEAVLREVDQALLVQDEEHKLN